MLEVALIFVLICLGLALGWPFIVVAGLGCFYVLMMVVAIVMDAYDTVKRKVKKLFTRSK